MYTNLIFLPLYNGLVGIMDLIPGVDVGVAVVIFTVVIRLILYPLSKSSILTQARMKDAEPEAAKIRSQYAADRQTQATKIMELYKSRNIKPFAGILLLIIQLPILLALISVFYKITPAIHPELLYSFIHVPLIKISFLGMDLTQKSLILSIATGVIQFFQLNFSLAAKQQKDVMARTRAAGTQLDSASAMANTMTTQMKYMLPLLAFASTYWLIPARFPQAAAIIALYWSTSALFTLLQELYIRKKHLN